MHDNGVFILLLLEMGKGVTLRREMRAELSSKVDFPGNTTDLGWPKRIVCEGDDSVHHTNDNNNDDDDDPMDVDDDVDGSLQFRMRPTRRVVLREHGAEYFEQLRDMYDEEHVLDDAEFQEKFVDILPSHWTVCSITMDVDNDELYLVRLRCKEEPIVVKLSLTRMQDRLADQPVPDYRDAVETLESIIAASDQTIQDGKTCTRKQDVDAWWSKRTQLDLQLKRLLKTMEHGWFGAFKVRPVFSSLGYTHSICSTTGIPEWTMPRTSKSTRRISWLGQSNGLQRSLSKAVGFAASDAKACGY